MTKLELIDWSERYPALVPIQIAQLQSTRCLCGTHKEIGKFTCQPSCRYTDTYPKR